MKEGANEGLVSSWCFYIIAPWIAQSEWSWSESSFVMNSSHSSPSPPPSSSSPSSSSFSPFSSSLFSSWPWRVVMKVTLVNNLKTISITLAFTCTLKCCMKIPFVRGVLIRFIPFAPRRLDRDWVFFPTKQRNWSAWDNQLNSSMAIHKGNGSNRDDRKRDKPKTLIHIVCCGLTLQLATHLSTHLLQLSSIIFHIPSILLPPFSLSPFLLLDSIW